MEVATAAAALLLQDIAIAPAGLQVRDWAGASDGEAAATADWVFVENGAVLDAASWAELRHDTLLYAKQSYSAAAGCEYPDAYVDPYPAFYGKLEAFAGLIVGLGLLVGGAMVIREGFGSQADPHPGWQGWAVLGVAVVSIFVNLGLAFVAQRADRHQASAGLAALARDNGSDALAGVLVVVALLASRSGLGWAEPVAAVGIGVLILVLGWRTSREGFDVLTDRVADRGLRARVEALGRSVPDVRGVQAVRVHPVGNGVRVDMELSVDADSSVAEGHRIAHAVESRVTKAESLVREVSVHVNPADPAPEPDECYPDGPAEAGSSS